MTSVKPNNKFTRKMNLLCNKVKFYLNNMLTIPEL